MRKAEFILQFLCKRNEKQIPDTLLMVFFNKFSLHGTSTLGGETCPKRNFAVFANFGVFAKAFELENQKKSYL